MSKQKNISDLIDLSNSVDKYIVKEQLDGELQRINLGPTHPSTHGISQIYGGIHSPSI